MQPAPHQCYERVALPAWECRSAAGDAAASWSAVRDGHAPLLHRSGMGWHGVLAGAGATCATLDEAVADAADEAWKRMGDDPEETRIGTPALVISASKGDPGAWRSALAGDRSRFVPALPGRLTGAVARRLGVRRWLGAPPIAACSTGLHALLEAADLIERAVCRQGLAGAGDASLTPLMIAGFTALGVLCGDRRPTAFASAGSPSTGFAPAEGVGMIALCDRELAPSDGWRLVCGVRLGDAGHATRFTHPATLHRCLLALWSALPEPDLIITHGTGTASGDAYERTGLEAGPWSAAPRLACKPVIGHSLGASGAVELALGLSSPARRMWKLSLGFGGHLAAVAMARG